MGDFCKKQETKALQCRCNTPADCPFGGFPNQFASPCIFLPGVPVTSASRLPDVELAVLLLLLALKLGQGPSNYLLAHEELRERSCALLKKRCLLLLV